MTEARRLLERLTTDEAMSYPVDHGNPGDAVKVSGQLHCDYCDANVDSDGPHNDGCPWSDARAYLAMTTCEGEQPTFNGSPISWATYRWLTAVYVRRVWGR